MLISAFDWKLIQIFDPEQDRNLYAVFTISLRRILTVVNFSVTGTVTWFRKRSREKSWGVYALSAVSLWSLYRCLLSSVISVVYTTRISVLTNGRRRGWVKSTYISLQFPYQRNLWHNRVVEIARGQFEPIHLRIINPLSRLRVIASDQLRPEFNSTLIPVRTGYNSTDSGWESWFTDRCSIILITVPRDARLSISSFARI